MSENTRQLKGATKGGKGLGRGLGSLLSGEDGAFAKMSPGADKTLQALTEKLPSRNESSLQHGFVEATSAPMVAPVAAVPNHLRIWQIEIEKIEANPNQ